MIDGKSLGEAIERDVLRLGCLCLIVGGVLGAIIVAVLWWIFS